MRLLLSSTLKFHHFMTRLVYMQKPNIITLVILILLFTKLSFCDSSAQIWEKTKKLVSEGKFEEAEKIYEELLVNYPTDANIVMGAGYLKYHQGKLALKACEFNKAYDLFSEAKKMFEISANIGDPKTKTKAYFNIGNCSLALGNFVESSKEQVDGVNLAEIFKDAVNSYRKALDTNPNFTEAKRNLEYALYKWKKSLNSEKKKDQQRNEDKDSLQKKIYSSFIDALTELPQKEVQIDPQKSNILRLEDKNNSENKKSNVEK